MRRKSGPVLLTLFLLVVPCRADDESNTEPDALARRAGGILRRNCLRCHKGSGSESGYAFRVTDVNSLDEDGMLIAGDPENSELFAAMYRGSMPPRNRPQLPRPSAEEVDTIREWIAAGASPIPPPPARAPIGLVAELTAIHSDLTAAGLEDRPGLRYFSLTHLYNDPTVDEAQLALTRLALVKALNSLSWQTDLVHPRAVNDEQTLYAVDIRDLGWNRDIWNAMVESYPYAVAFGALDDLRPDELDRKIRELRRDQRPVVLRADWFVSVATKPPLYHTVLFDLQLDALRERETDSDNPSNPKAMTDLDLESHLGVPVSENIRRGRAQRSGFTESGVSGQNRMVERHPLGSNRGAYWKSYDFKSSNRTAILSEFPLGPKFDGNDFSSLAFEHDGGEIIFNLPNGMQGYLLIDGEGNRIDAGPIDVVADSLKTSGNEQIVTGLSCIACHRRGMIETPDDEVRGFSGTAGEARLQVRRLYAENDGFRTLVDRDRELFVNTLGEMWRPFDPPPGADDVPWEELPEPVGEVARRYLLDSMTIETVAAELWIPVDQLRAGLQANPELHRLGLRVLLREGGTIKRAAWEAPEIFPLMLQTARQFGYDPR